ncbi:hypothetical protein EV186_104158 [Labedaea rhizosphaerae]|uniref:Uncharacterized protein n=2 Tax=Labedaea rhizosphaerae TaxID=598644 RepID=A0A4R6SB23_LABRH|nr:hypothetical protein EV186_104158 [Labedaea rhizosphaerae]
MELDVVVWVGDHARLRGGPGHRAAYALTNSDAPVDWDKATTIANRDLLTVETDPQGTVGAFAKQALQASWNDRADVLRVWAEDAVTGASLADDAVVGEVLDPGDLVVVKAEVPSTSSYQLLSLGRPEQLFDVLHVSAALEVAAWPRLWGAFLYTEEDADLATYVRTHFDELNALSGKHLRLFVVERPPDWKRAKKYWRAQIEPPLLRALATMRWLKTMPYDKSGLYDVARDLGVAPDQFPCLVLFGGSSDDTIIFPIRSAAPAAMRELFATILGAIGDEPVDYQPDKVFEDSRDRHRREPSVQGAEALQALAASASWADRAALARVEAAKQAVREVAGPNVIVAHGNLRDLTFTGPTTFINKPIDTVISDFQNTYASTAGGQLAEVLRLVLTSADLAPADKVDLARRVTDAVAYVESDDENERWSAKYALQDIEIAAYRGRDIADAVRTIIRNLRNE